MPSISFLLCIFLIFFVIILFMYIVYLNGEYKKVMQLYSDAIKEQEKMEGKFFEYNEKVEKLYKEISDLKIEKANLIQDKEHLKKQILKLKKINEELKAKIATLEDIY